jgi:hypothetical protein
VNRTRLLGLALIASSATGFAALAPARAATAPNGGMTWRQRAVADKSDYTEPSLSIDRNGNIVVCSPGDGGTRMWISEDDGTSFRESRTLVEDPQATGGGDCEVHFMPDGTLLNTDLAISTSYIHTSDDLGRTWERQDDAGLEQDRQWFASYDKGEPVAYHVYHGIADELEFYVKSTDDGKTWSQPIPVNQATQANCTPNAIAKPGDEACLTDQDYNTFSGPMLVDQNTGELYVVYGISDAATNGTSVGGFGSPRGIVVAHSTDGTTWTNKYATIINGTIIDQKYTASGFPWGVIDPAGNVYIVFNSNADGGHYHTYYAYSTDHAATWSAPVKLDDNPIPEGATVFSTGASVKEGIVDFAWVETDAATTTDDPAALWYINMAQVTDAATGTPKITHSRVSDHVMHRGDICLHGTLCQVAPGGLGGGSRTLGDFFELSIGPDGMAQVAFTDDGREGEPAQVWWAKQASGPSAYGVPVVAPPKEPTGPDATAAPRPPAQPPAAPPAAAPDLAATGLPQAVPSAAQVLMGLAGAVLALRRRRPAA